MAGQRSAGQNRARGPSSRAAAAPPDPAGRRTLARGPPSLPTLSAARSKPPAGPRAAAAGGSPPAAFGLVGCLAPGAGLGGVPHGRLGAAGAGAGCHLGGLPAFEAFRDSPGEGWPETLKWSDEALKSQHSLGAGKAAIAARFRACALAELGRGGWAEAYEGAALLAAGWDRGLVLLEFGHQLSSHEREAEARDAYARPAGPPDRSFHADAHVRQPGHHLPAPRPDR